MHSVTVSTLLRWIGSLVLLSSVLTWAPGSPGVPPMAVNASDLGSANPGVLFAINVNLDQCANQNSPCDWQNGNLNGNNSAYAEGRVVPFRLAIEGLTAGTHTIHINYDFTAGGHKAYDFLATYNATENVDACAAGGGADSSLCPSLPAPDVKPFPTDSFVSNGKSVSGAEDAAGVSRNLTMYGGTITGITAPTHSGSGDGNSIADLVVTFTTTGSAAFFLWGGHLALSGYWDSATSPNGAGQISGAPWHMRTQGLDGDGNKNQDRSIQPSALAVTPTAATVPPTPTATSTTEPPTATPTGVPPTATHTAVPLTATPTATPTGVPSTATPATPPAQHTPTATPTGITVPAVTTATPVPPTPTAPPGQPTATPVPPTATSVPPTATTAPGQPTATPVPPTATPQPSQSEPTSTPVPPAPTVAGESVPPAATPTPQPQVAAAAVPTAPAEQIVSAQLPRAGGIPPLGPFGLSTILLAVGAVLRRLGR